MTLAALQRVPDLQQPAFLTLEPALAALQGVNSDATVALTLESEKHRRDWELEQEIASRPRVEVTSTSVQHDRIGSPEVVAVIRNNYDQRIDALDLVVYAYNRFDEGLGGQCGRFPTFYSSSRVRSQTGGESFTFRGDTLCVDSVTRFEVQISRVHFSDGTTWSP